MLLRLVPPSPSRSRSSSTKAEAGAQRKAQQATSRLESEAAAMLSQDRPGGDVQAMQQLSPRGPPFRPGHRRRPVVGALQRLARKIADARAGVLNVAVAPMGNASTSSAMTTLAVRVSWNLIHSLLWKPIKPSSPSAGGCVRLVTAALPGSITPSPSLQHPPGCTKVLGKLAARPAGTGDIKTGQ